MLNNEHSLVPSAALSDNLPAVLENLPEGVFPSGSPVEVRRITEVCPQVIHSGKAVAFVANGSVKNGLFTQTNEFECEVRTAQHATYHKTFDDALKTAIQRSKSNKDTYGVLAYKSFLFRRPKYKTHRIDVYRNGEAKYLHLYYDAAVGTIRLRRNPEKGLLCIVEKDHIVQLDKPDSYTIITR